MPKEKEVVQELQLVSFSLGNEEFALDILKVQEINRMAEITPIPKAPVFVEGVMNLRGKIVPVIDLRKRFYLESKPYDKLTRIIMVNLDGKTIGLIVDSVSEVLRLPLATIELPPAIVASIDTNYIEGVGKWANRLLILLNLEKLLSGLLKNLRLGNGPDKERRDL